MTARLQLERMLAMVPYLQAHQGIAIEDVATQFGITEAQARREVLALMTTGTGSMHGEMIDLDLEAFEDGAVHIRNADFMPRPLRVTPAEGASLVVALGLLRQLAPSALTATIDRVTMMLEHAIGTSTTPAIDVHVETPPDAVKDAASTALQHSRQLRIVHASEHSDRQTERIVDPLEITSQRGHMYLSAWCHRAEDHRNFRLDRILEAEVLDAETVSRTPEPSDSLFAPGPDTPWAILDVSPGGRWLVEANQAEVLERHDDRSWRVRMYGVDDEWLQRLVLRGGGAITVIEPIELRTRVTETVEAALAAYHGTQ